MHMRKTFHTEETTLMFIKDCSLIHIVMHSRFLSVIPCFVSHLFKDYGELNIKNCIYHFNSTKIDHLAMSTNSSRDRKYSVRI